MKNTATITVFLTDKAGTEILPPWIFHAAEADGKMTIELTRRDNAPVTLSDGDTVTFMFEDMSLDG